MLTIQEVFHESPHTKAELMIELNLKNAILNRKYNFSSGIYGMQESEFIIYYFVLISFGNLFCWMSNPDNIESVQILTMS